MNILFRFSSIKTEITFQHTYVVFTLKCNSLSRMGCNINPQRNNKKVCGIHKVQLLILLSIEEPVNQKHKLTRFFPVIHNSNYFSN